MVRYILAVLLLGLVPAAVAFAADGDQPKTPATKPHMLPEDGNAVIITYDHSGGMILRRNTEPVLVVHADGTLHAGNPYAAAKGCDGKLTPEELQSLLQDILDVQQFAKIENDDLKLPSRVMVTDATTVSIAITLPPEVDKTIRVHAPRVDPNAPADAPQARFAAIQHRLEQVVQTTLLGGSAELAKILKATNLEMKKTLPTDPPMETGDLLWVRTGADSASTAMFSKKVIEAKGWHMVQATVTRTAAGEITVKVARGAEQPNP